MDESKQNPERRLYKRINSDIVIKVEEMTSEAGSKLACSKNISLGGVLFEYNKSFPISTVLNLELRIPQIGKRLDTYAKVVRVNELFPGRLYDIAVRFVSLDDESKKLLEKYISNS